MVDNAIHGDLELLPLKNAKGAIWMFFGFQSKDGEFVEKDKRKRDVVYCKALFSINEVLWKYGRPQKKFVSSS